MTLGPRDRRALIALGVAVALSAGVYLWYPSGSATAAAPAVDSIPVAEKRLAKLQQVAASAPGKQKTLDQVMAELRRREKGLLDAETAAQAQALLLQMLRRLSRSQAPPLEIRSVEIGPVYPLGADYGEALVSVSFDCRVEQMVNLLADLTAQPELLATHEIRVNAGDPKQKTLGVRLTVSGAVAKRLVPERKGLAAF
jgi:hypothetical protein